ncbi:DUF3592 domain-containing protein [Streptomyces yerevanensis]|uniref:DUF3592 domain-containing protein n=1 Tax=Streptomyces yerevanensis TaxID=66378 RepID=UPI0012FEDC1B|nr:DUF3592 domain-containing protein [Streptomyces yerevanensis]
MAIAVGVLVAFILCTLSVACAIAAHRIFRLRLRGVRTTGELVDYRIDTDSDGDDWYYLTVVFALPDGTRIESESANPVRRLPQGMGPGATTEVTYDAAAPRRVSASSIETTDRNFSDAFAYAITSVATLVGAGFVVIRSFTG